MSIATKAPPFDAQEVEKLARALVETKAHGAFFETPDGRISFEGPLSRWGAHNCLKALEGGCIYLIGFLRDGQRFREKGGVNYPVVDDMLWLDAEHARKVLGKAAELEVEVNFDLLANGTKARRTLEKLIVRYNSQLRENMPGYRKRLAGGIVIS